MCKNFWTSLEDLIEENRISTEIWSKHFNAGAGIQLMNFADCFCVEPSTFIFEIISSNTCDGCVLQSHCLNRFSDSAWFIAIKFFRFTSIDIAEIATTRTAFTADKESCLFIFPAFKNVGTCSFLANCVQTFCLHQRSQASVFRSHIGASLNPLRLSLDWSLGVTRFDAK